MRQAPLASLLAIAFAATPLIATSTAHAEDHCAEARALLGPKWVAPTSDAACKEALEYAEEEQWQLWLDLAFAEEATDNLEAAVAVYRRFIKSTLRRGEGLSESWRKMREEATFTVGRLEETLTKTRAKITIDTIPAGLPVRFTKEARRGEDATPVTRYLPAGEHIVVATDPTTGRTRELSFTVEVGQAREIKIDLRENSPLGVVEKTLPGDRTGSTQSAGGTADPVGLPGVQVRMDDDKTPPPRSVQSGTTLRRIGVGALGVGIAAAAVGTGFMLTSTGLSDEAACAGALCQVDTAARARAKGEASIAEDRALAGFITGGVFILGGALALIIDSLTDDSPVEAAQGPRLKAIAPMVGNGQAGLGATVGF